VSLNDVISDFATGTYTVTRTAAGAYTRGRYTAGSSTTFVLDACVQPLQGRELDSLQEGELTEEIRVIYSATELKTRTPDYEPDRISIDGESWTVIRVQRWQHWGEDHWRVFAAREKRP
jgi:hypothetical protein